MNAVLNAATPSRRNGRHHKICHRLLRTPNLAARDSQHHVVLDSKRAKRTIAFGSRCLLLDVTRVQHGVLVRDTEKSPPILWVVRYLYMQTPTSPARCLAFVQSSIVL
jgi:hypothetical protein